MSLARGKKVKKLMAGGGRDGLWSLGPAVLVGLRILVNMLATGSIL